MNRQIFCIVALLLLPALCSAGEVRTSKPLAGDWQFQRDGGKE